VIPLLFSLGASSLFCPFSLSRNVGRDRVPLSPHYVEEKEPEPRTMESSRTATVPMLRRSPLSRSYLLPTPSGWFLRISYFIIHQIFSLARDWSKRVTWLSMPHLETGEYLVKWFPNFQNWACCKKYFQGNKYSSLHLAQKHARIFVLGHYLLLKTHSFPWATLSENSSLLAHRVSASFKLAPPLSPSLPPTNRRTHLIRNLK